MTPKKASAPNYFGFILIFFLILPCTVTAIDRFGITPSTTNSNDGSVNLSWTIPDHTLIELQQATRGNPTYKLIYKGTDTATVITGLPDGNYLYRARLILNDGNYTEWTEPVSVIVEHHSLVRAFLFFFVGGLVFLGTFLLILFGAKAATKRGDVL